jgi:Fur family transcriptional regulator, ferric uptake regulator
MRVLLFSYKRFIFDNRIIVNLQTQINITGINLTLDPLSYITCQLKMIFIYDNIQDVKLTANKIAGILREHGYKLTTQRHALLKVIASHHDHLSPDTLYEIARQEYPGIGKVTIYRTLELLSNLNLVCRVHAPDGCRSYMMRRPTGHHHHLVCSGCGRAVDFTDCDLGSLEKKLADQTGFRIEGHLLELYGQCDTCRSKSGS